MGKLLKKIDWVLKNTTILALTGDKKDEHKSSKKKSKWSWSK